jgi:hypothetical protein
MTDIKEARAQLRRFYALTTQLKVQLQALDETAPRVRVEIQEVDPPGDIEAVALLVLIAASTSGQEDLKAIMAEVKAITEAKAKLRSLLEQQTERGLDLFSVNAVISAVIARAELCRTVEGMQNDLDSISELGETESLRLQMAMDRISKLMSTLSNILKKMSDTASQITQNLK